MFFFLASPKISSQATIWTNPITGSNPAAANPYTAGQTVNANLTASGVGYASGLSALTSTNTYNIGGWTTNATIDDTQYFSFTLTPATGYKMNMSSFVYTGTAGSRAPRSFAFRSDVNGDNFTTNVGSPNTAGTTINLTGADYQNLSTATSFRFYGFNCTSGSTAARSYSINDFTFSGSVLGSDTTALNFGTTNPYASAPVRSFQINASGLSPANATITINGSTNFEVSTTSSTAGFGSTATLTATGGNLSGSTVWVRLKASTLVGTYLEDITFEGGGFTAFVIPCNGKIIPKELTLNSPLVASKTYDGTTTATVSGTLSGIVGSEVVTFNNIGTFATKDVGNGISVTMTNSLSGTNAANYTLVQPTGLTGNITAKPLTVTALNHSKCLGVNHTLPSNGYTISGLVGSESVGSVTLSSTGNPSGAAVGTYPIVAQNASGGTFKATNYAITYVNGTLTVDPISVGGTVSTASTSICSGSSATLSLINYTGTIQWQSSAMGGAWLNVAGATGSTYVTPALTQNVSYQALVTSGACAAVSSNSVGLTVGSAPTAVLSGTTTTCVGGNANLTVNISGSSGQYTVVYNDGTSNVTVNNYVNGSVILVSPSVTKTYTLVSVTTASGCSAVVSGSAVVTVGNDSTTWNGTTWSNGEPTASKAAIISGAFTSPGTSTTPYNLRACKLTVTNNASVLISSGDSVTLDGAITVNPGCLVTFNSNANLLQKGNTNTNSGSIVVKRNSAPIKRLDYTLWSCPVGSQQLLAFSPNTLTNRFYDYNTDTNQYQTVDPAVTNFTPVKGYLVRVANNHPNQPTPWLGQFTGVPNNGNYSMALQNFGPGKRFNLIGNPYPSPIDADVFISENIANGSITGTVYFWRKTNGGTNGGYCTYNLGGFNGNGESILTLPQYNENSANVIQTGQGFLVEATGSGTVVFNNDMRINNTTNRFMRNNNTINTVERNRIWLNVTDANGSFSQTMIAYMTGATQGVDQAIDGKLIIDGDITLASLIGNESYAIQGRTLPFDASDVVPLSLKVTTPGDYTISIDRVDGLFAGGGQSVYLRDNTTGDVHNLTEGGYTFTTASGTFDSRFEVLYQAPLAITTPVFNESQVVIYKTLNNELSINTGNVVMSSVKIFDVTGRLLTSEKNINSNHVLLSSGITTEILVVQIISNEGLKVTKKVLFPKTAIKIDKKTDVKILVAEDE
nr:YDG domain-containing protein [uncultured Flavobacterium sp.]